MSAPLAMGPVVEPAEVEVDFEVTIVPKGPLHLLSDDGRAALAELMDSAQSVALATLAGARPPLPTSLAARLAILLRCWDELITAEGAQIDSPVQDDALAHAVGAAREEFDLAFNALKTRFEEEFPQ